MIARGSLFSLNEEEIDKSKLTFEQNNNKNLENDEKFIENKNTNNNTNENNNNGKEKDINLVELNENKDTLKNNNSIITVNTSIDDQSIININNNNKNEIENNNQKEINESDKNNNIMEVNEKEKVNNFEKNEIMDNYINEGKSKLNNEKSNINNENTKSTIYDNGQIENNDINEKNTTKNFNDSKEIKKKIEIIKKDMINEDKDNEEDSENDNVIDSFTGNNTISSLQDTCDENENIDNFNENDSSNFAEGEEGENFEKSSIFDDNLNQMKSDKEEIEIKDDFENSTQNDINTSMTYTLYGPILVISNCRGNISQINTLIKEKNAKAVIHCGDFGFLDKDSVKYFNEKHLKYYVEHTSCISFEDKKKLFENMSTLKENVCNNFILSELLDFVEGKKTLLAPVYVVYGQYEDVSVIDKILHKKIYKIKNLFIVDEMNSYSLKFSNSETTLRLFGIGGGYLDNNLFNNGEGEFLHAGSNSHTWLTMFQLGQLLKNAENYEKNTDEIRILITTANPMKKSLIAQLGLALQANFHISPGNQNIRYHVSFNLQSITDKKHYFNRLLEGHSSFEKTYQKIKDQLKDSVDEIQNDQLERALNIMNHIPKDNIDFRSCWYWIVPCMKYGSLALDYVDKKISINMSSNGVYFFRHQDKHEKKLEKNNENIIPSLIQKNEKETFESFTNNKSIEVTENKEITSENEFEISNSNKNTNIEKKNTKNPLQSNLNNSFKELEEINVMLKGNNLSNINYQENNNGENKENLVIDNNVKKIKSRNKSLILDKNIKIKTEENPKKRNSLISSIEKENINKVGTYQNKNEISKSTLNKNSKYNYQNVSNNNLGLLTSETNSSSMNPNIANIMLAKKNEGSKIINRNNTINKNEESVRNENTNKENEKNILSFNNKINELWKNPELIPNYQPQSQQKKMQNNIIKNEQVTIDSNISSNESQVLESSELNSNITYSGKNESMTQIKSSQSQSLNLVPAVNLNSNYHQSKPQISTKKVLKNNQTSNWNNTINSNSSIGTSTWIEEPKSLSIKKKEREEFSSKTVNNEYDSSIIISGLSKDITEKAIYSFYNDYKIKNLKINRNSENILAYVDFESSSICKEAKKLNTLPLKENRKKYIGKQKLNEEEMKKSNWDLSIKNQTSNYKNSSYHNEMNTKQTLRKTKSNNNIYHGWRNMYNESKKNNIENSNTNSWNTSNNDSNKKYLRWNTSDSSGDYNKNSWTNNNSSNLKNNITISYDNENGSSMSNEVNEINEKKKNNHNRISTGSYDCYPIYNNKTNNNSRLQHQLSAQFSQQQQTQFYNKKSNNSSVGSGWDNDEKSTMTWNEYQSRIGFGHESSQSGTINNNVNTNTNSIANSSTIQNSNQLKNQNRNPNPNQTAKVVQPTNISQSQTPNIILSNQAQTNTIQGINQNQNQNQQPPNIIHNINCQNTNTKSYQKISHGNSIGENEITKLVTLPIEDNNNNEWNTNASNINNGNYIQTYYPDNSSFDNINGSSNFIKNIYTNTNSFENNYSNVKNPNVNSWDNFSNINSNCNINPNTNNSNNSNNINNNNNNTNYCNNLGIANSSWGNSLNESINIMNNNSNSSLLTTNNLGSNDVVSSKNDDYENNSWGVYHGNTTTNSNVNNNSNNNNNGNSWGYSQPLSSTSNWMNNDDILNQGGNRVNISNNSINNISGTTLGTSTKAVTSSCNGWGELAFYNITNSQYEKNNIWKDNYNNNNSSILKMRNELSSNPINSNINNNNTTKRSWEINNITDNIYG